MAQLLCALSRVRDRDRVRIRLRTFPSLYYRSISEDPQPDGGFRVSVPWRVPMNLFTPAAMHPEIGRLFSLVVLWLLLCAGTVRAQTPGEVSIGAGTAIPSGGSAENYGAGPEFQPGVGYAPSRSIVVSLVRRTTLPLRWVRASMRSCPRSSAYLWTRDTAFISQITAAAAIFGRRRTGPSSRDCA